MTIVIIEDEPLSAKQLHQYIAGLDGSMHIAANLRSVKQCMAWFTTNKMPDVIFSDIELLDGNVFSFFDTVAITCPIIFTTAYDQFLLRAFDGNGIAYLLKPFAQEQVHKAIQKLQQLKKAEVATISVTVLQQLQQALDLQQNPSNYKQRFVVKMRTGIYLLPVSEISCIQADGALVHAFNSNGKKYPLTGTLASIEEQLDPSFFFRINRSDIVTITAIERIEPYFGDRLAVYITGQKAAVISSTQRTPDFRKWVDK